jgi:hypothetical protein
MSNTVLIRRNLVRGILVRTLGKKISDSITNTAGLVNCKINGKKKKRYSEKTSVEKSFEALIGT